MLAFVVMAAGAAMAAGAVALAAGVWGGPLAARWVSLGGGLTAIVAGTVAAVIAIRRRAAEAAYDDDETFGPFLDGVFAGDADRDETPRLRSPAVPAAIRAATRALLASIEDELQDERQRQRLTRRRAGCRGRRHPALRRARPLPRRRHARAPGARSGLFS